MKVLKFKENNNSKRKRTKKRQPIHVSSQPLEEFMKPKIKLVHEEQNQKIYLADNLDLLKSLPSNSINLIYCDILYNSGKVFDDYNDNLGTPQDAMEWYKPRIEEMKRVLTSNGSIYLHCNWRVDSYLRCLLDEIFGYKNFRNRIYRQHSEERGFHKNFDSQMDIIFYYTKDTENFVFNKVKGKTPKLYPIYENGYVEGASEEYSYKNFNFNPKKNNKHFIISKQMLNRMIDNDEIVFVDGFPFRRTYEIPVGNLWNEENMLDDYSRNKLADAYDTPKPLAILDRIILTSSNEGDVIADFFMGGGSTVLSAIKHNRKGIYCDISQKAIRITKEKIRMEGK